MKFLWVVYFFHQICAKLYKVAELVKVSAKQLDEFIKQVVVKGYTKAKEIIDFIKHHFFPDLKGGKITKTISRNLFV